MSQSTIYIVTQMLNTNCTKSSNVDKIKVSKPMRLIYQQV